MVKINREYPICDTDIWIKHSKYDKFYKKDLLFSKYEKIYMADAVRQEIRRERFDNKKEDFKIYTYIILKSSYLVNKRFV